MLLGSRRSGVEWLMIVCSCNALTNHDIADAVRRGASRPNEVYASKGCKAQCGNCVPGVVCALRSLIRERKEAAMAFAPVDQGAGSVAYA
ncbi:bacterioferritin-associated ferredoxin [Asaia krungthepensis NRIC 0535]|uniref:Bacterioferritin-associated ferredoxin n=2 Tax=Asaia krungthepensis TaxID=220990 RepID=A0ABQ0Q2F2_9PROT|nr:bacterioferritin-associated ferredoxin [Asaia krungthepensis NRIC 0535]